MSKSPGPKAPRATRRRFTRRLALAATASLVIPTDSLAAEEPEKKPADPTAAATDALTEPRLTAIAHACQQATDWHTRRPPQV